MVLLQEIDLMALAKTDSTMGQRYRRSQQQYSQASIQVNALHRCHLQRDENLRINAVWINDNLSGSAALLEIMAFNF